MDLLFIIYILLLFIIFSPNFLFTSRIPSSLFQSFVHAILFSILFYLTHRYFEVPKKEGITIGTYETNLEDKVYDIEISDTSLGALKPFETTDTSKTILYENEMKSSSPSINNETETENDITSSEKEELLKMPSYDYSKFRRYDYDSMKKKIEKLRNHHHRNEYFDLVPNFRSTNHEILCAADYGKNTTCCRQPENYVHDDHVCGPLKPYCTNYIHNVQWGKCVANNPYRKPNIGRDPVENIINTQVLNNGNNVEIQKDDDIYKIKQCSA